MFCSKCGAKLKDNSAFCHVCGARIEEESAAPVSPAEQSVATPVAPVAPVAPVSPMEQSPVTPSAPVSQPVYEPMNQGYQAPAYDSMSRNYQTQAPPSPSADEMTVNQKKPNLLVLLIEAVLAIGILIAAYFWIMKPAEEYKESRKDIYKKSDDYVKNTATDTPTPTRKATPKPTATQAPTHTPAATATPRPTPSPTPTPIPLSTDTGDAFVMKDGIMHVDSTLFGRTYEECNEYFYGAIPPLMDWEWSSVPLTWNAVLYTDGRGYTLFFEHNKLIGIRDEAEIPSYHIPDDLLQNAINTFGQCDQVIYGDSGPIEYIWYNVGDVRGEYAIFLNPYDNKNYVCQQYTYRTFSGTSIEYRP